MTTTLLEFGNSPELDVGKDHDTCNDADQSNNVLPQIPSCIVCNALAGQVFIPCHIVAGSENRKNLCILLIQSMVWKVTPSYKSFLKM